MKPEQDAPSTAQFPAVAIAAPGSCPDAETLTQPATVERAVGGGAVGEGAVGADPEDSWARWQTTEAETEPGAETGEVAAFEGDPEDEDDSWLELPQTARPPPPRSRRRS